MSKKFKIIIFIIILFAFYIIANILFLSNMSTKDIKSAKLKIVEWNSEYDGDSYFPESNLEKMTFNTTENIELVKKLNKEAFVYHHPIIIAMFEKSGYRLEFEYDYLFKIKKSYYISDKRFNKLNKIDKLYESKETKNKLKISNTDAIKNGKYMGDKVEIELCIGDDYILYRCKNPESLVNCIDLDIEERTFKQEMDTSNYIGYIEFSGKNLKKDIGISVYKRDKHVIKWLKDNKSNFKSY